MAQSFQQLSCAFSHSLNQIFRIDCLLNKENYYDLKKRIQEKRGLQDHDINLWVLYRPGNILDKNATFVPAENNNDRRLPSHLPISLDPEPGDPDIDIVIVVVDQKLGVSRKDISIEFADAGLPYKPPLGDTLTNPLSPRHPEYHYQPSPELQRVLHEQVAQHYKYYKQGFIDKITIPIYLFFSGARTGKSRNAAEFSKTIIKCFDGTFFKEKKNNELATRLKKSFVFHVNLMDFQVWEHPWNGIGSRMLIQLLQKGEIDHEKVSMSDVYTWWYAPSPTQVIRVLETRHPQRESIPVVLVIDNLHKILETQGDRTMYQVLTLLKGFARRGFTLVCATSAIDGPVDELGSQRVVHLPCNPPQ